MPEDYKFSHYETCYDADGYQWLKAWYVNTKTGLTTWSFAD